MAVTIKDVAKRANVSPATVSLVIHNNKRISPETRARVLRAIKELNYHPSRSARGLVSRQTGNIGFILRDDHFTKSEPFYTKVFLGTEFQAREDEYYILLTTVHSDFRESDPLPRFVLERNVEGIILAGKIPGSLITGLETYKLPMVFVDYVPPEGNYPMVLIDNISGGREATRHLIDLGHRRIAFIGGDFEHPSIRERFQGYRMALEDAGIPIDPALIVTDEPNTDRACGYQAAEKLFRQTDAVSAVFACNDAMAIGLLRYCRTHGISVPDQLSLVGFDDVESDLLVDPPLSTMRVPKEELGIQAMRLMVEMLKSQTIKPKKVLVPVELVVRGSSQPVTVG
ncbi:MAG: LacI family transcriptional regulator [Calditrichaeota bacterium]|nr:MAG: LacI family transcriptional regulator [Calditrichota bacterium]